MQRKCRLQDLGAQLLHLCRRSERRGGLGRQFMWQQPVQIDSGAAC